MLKPLPVDLGDLPPVLDLGAPALPSMMMFEEQGLTISEPSEMALLHSKQKSDSTQLTGPSQESAGDSDEEGPNVPIDVLLAAVDLSSMEESKIASRKDARAGLKRSAQVFSVIDFLKGRKRCKLDEEEDHF